jgi:hypothetical protein
LGPLFNDALRIFREILQVQHGNEAWLAREFSFRAASEPGNITDVTPAL